MGLDNYNALSMFRGVVGGSGVVAILSNGSQQIKFANHKQIHLN